VKSNTDIHREALDQALRVALGTSQPALRKQALARAASHLIHPKLILESPLLTDAHVWRKEGLLVSDAFEAVTNGMEEPGVLEALDELEPDSPFQDWRHLILALHFFYEGLDEAVVVHLNQIPANSPVQTLVNTLLGILQENAERGTTAQRRLSELVAQPDPLVQLWVQDVAEGLETGDENLFWEALTDWLEHMASTAPERAKSAVLWAWNQLEWREFDEAVLLALGTSLWGKAESYRLAALGTLPWDPEGAALLWVRFLLTAVRDDQWDEPTLASGQELALRFREAAEASTPSSKEWQETWNNLCAAWNAEVHVRGWPRLCLGRPSFNTPPLVSRPTPDGQLDLFA